MCGPAGPPEPTWGTMGRKPAADARPRTQAGAEPVVAPCYEGHGRPAAPRPRGADAACRARVPPEEEAAEHTHALKKVRWMAIFPLLPAHRGWGADKWRGRSQVVVQAGAARRDALKWQRKPHISKPPNATASPVCQSSHSSLPRRSQDDHTWNHGTNTTGKGHPRKQLALSKATSTDLAGDSLPRAFPQTSHIALLQGHNGSRIGNSLKRHCWRVPRNCLDPKTQVV